MGEILVNAKFLGAGLNGVHRTAAEFTQQLVRRARQPGAQATARARGTCGHEENGHTVRLLSPPGAEARAGLTPEVRRGAFGAGQGWEMLTLPRAARGSLLVNFCNLAPLLHTNSAVMIHDAQTFLYPEDYSGRQARAYRRLLPWIGRRARRVLTVSEFARQSLASFGIAPLDKIDVVHNGTDHLTREAPDPEILRRLGLAPGSYVLTVGSAKGYKNMRTVFEALRDPLAGGQRLVVAGGPGALAYHDRGWTPPAHALFSGFVSDAELRALYAGASAFLFPSLTEGFGLPPVEAMHSATPVIAAHAGAMPEVCSDGALLVPPEDPQAWREAVDALLSSRELARHLVARGGQRAAQLSWNAAGDRLWQVLEPLVPPTRPATAGKASGRPAYGWDSGGSSLSTSSAISKR
ncbi:glycosyltransferase family 4 protein [Novosphingobium mangrovi (ex Hu et al. 2023)]|uniref:Glycosyltransferase family 4 protein n=1 Tax=Novosphingobium mangrovi (ex Hu et al. 2023) TaxID=2930094 RepID=A0ABT0AHQ9_9SPHN|nr:glycosyltransferase family 1 protein [Novosphingobium mangrovi (ex Hu et al. 2023)]MCJ1962717.1 glycosyltransferase family 4 protein [Novosphingobium mangrovi (ex Hu et al. 2023)]